MGMCAAMCFGLAFNPSCITKNVGGKLILHYILMDGVEILTIFQLTNQNTSHMH